MKHLVPNLFLSCIFLTTHLLLSAQTTVTLTPSADATVGFHDGSNSANTNYGYADYYGAFYQPGAFGYGYNGGRSLMNFDFSVIPPGVTITSASLNLYGRGPYGIGDAVSHGNYGDDASYLQRITTSWSENGVTWNTQPGSTTANEILLPSSIDSIQDYLNINVTALVQDLYSNPTSSYGIMMKLVNESVTRSLAFCSRDFADASKWPLLSITYTCSAAQVIKSPIADACIGFHDGFNSANTNYGSADFYSAFSQPGVLYGENAGQGLMNFDFSDIPQGAIVTSATLDLYGRGPYGAGDAVSVGNIGQNDSYLRRIILDWDEFSVTWNTQPTSTSTNEVVLPASNQAIQDYLGIDVTQLVQDIIDNPMTSFGFDIALQTEDPTRSLAFCSRDYPDNSKIPQLTINYNCGEGTSINSLKPSEGYYLFPNLTSGNFVVKIPEDGLFSNPELRIFDIDGKVVFNSRLNLITTSFNLSTLPKGIYFYNIIGENTLLATGKVIFQ